MYTLNHRYTDAKSFKEWVNKNLCTNEEYLVQLFCGVPKKIKLEQITSLIETKLPKAKIIGTTTDGEIYQDTATRKEIIISVTYFEKSSVVGAYEEYSSNSYEMGKNIAQKLYKQGVKVLILYTTGLAINGESFLDGVNSISKNRCIITGGMAGDNNKFLQTYVSANSKVLSKGCVGVAISGEKLNAKSLYKFGWEAVGLPMVVTKSKDNIVYEIDNMPVIEVYKKYFGKELADELPKIGVQIPLIVERNGIKMGRACINKLDDSSLMFAGNLKEGEIVRFGVGSIDSVVSDSRPMCQEIRKYIMPESIFIYSCMARRRLLEAQSSYELEQMGLKCNVSGYFTYGEFYSDERGVYLFNESMSILALGENEYVYENKEQEIKHIQISESKNNKMLDALTHMTNVMAKEWHEKLRMENEKNKIQEKMLFQNAKQAQMGEMIGMIAHQWRQPLNAISATGINLSILSGMGKLDDEKVEEISEFIQDQCQKMSNTIDTFMNFVKPAKEAKEFNISHTIESLMQIMGTQLKNHDIKVTVDKKEDISIIGHEDLLEQVIINLLSNARDAFSSIDRKDKYIKITLDKKENSPVIYVEDNAGGIPEDITDKIFNPYFTTKEQGKGTGIGLYMSLDIMRKSFDGDLVHKNIEGGGSLFEITL